MMTKRNKQALYTLAISIPSFGLGLWSFEIGGGGGAVGLIAAIGITLGVAGIIAGGTMLMLYISLMTTTRRCNYGSTYIY